MYEGKYSVEEVELIEKAGCSVREVDKQWAMFPDQNLDTAVGSVVGLKNGRGQERNEPFSPAEGGEAAPSEEAPAEAPADAPAEEVPAEEPTPEPAA